MSVALNFIKVGEGEPLLIVHGLFGSLDNWKTMARNISEQGYAVYIIDLRNHGKSPHTSDISHSNMADDLVKFINDQQLGDVNLIGHSLGGKVAMHLALNHSELIKKLIVVDIAPKSYIARHNLYFEAMMSLDFNVIKSRSQAGEMLGEKIKNKAILQFLLKNLDRTENGNYKWKFNLTALHENYDDLIARISANTTFDKPTLFLSGQLSDYVTAGDEPDITALFPQVEFEAIKDSGHWVHAEKPIEFRDSVLKFLK